ncbi:FG-GAP-like repeat-containing protein [Salibacteraceae bacterium]|nr:FG-GAP-like repeat-containing protein [Salibacteraceae bacterium]
MKLRLIGIIVLVFSVKYSNAQVTTQWGPDGYVKIENNSGGLVANLQSGDRFSRDHDQAGDINGDGIIDLVVGARSDDDGAIDAGAVYILFMNTDGTVQSNQKISATEGGFTDTLDAGDFFGYGVAGIGDYDNDNIPDIAVTAIGRIYIIHLNNDGTVKSFVKNQNINSQGLSAIGDLNNDGRIDLVACQSTSNAGGTNRGAIQILFFDNTSNVINSSTVTISSTQGGFGTGLQDNDRFGGREVAMLGDIDNDGTKELAVGAFMSDGGKGAIWILSLDNTTFNVVSKLKITEGLNGFADTLTTGANPNGTAGASFGHALCKVGDLNGDGVPDLMTGANQQNEGWGYILYLNADKTVKTFTRINNTDGGFGLVLDSDERFSRSISFLGDLRGDGTIAVNYGGGAGGTGSLYLMFFKPCDFTQETGFNHWSGGTISFSNWNHNTQSLTSDSLTFEQCTFKAFETDAAYMTYNYNDGRCICMDSTATLAVSTELSTAFSNQCYSGVLSTNVIELNSEQQITIYPNPTISELVLEAEQISFTKQDNIKVFSILGKELYSSSINSQKTIIDLSKYSHGTYILVTTIDGIQKTFKILKE